ncbi:unnamed protein product [marine sediment metagenome]|uniref:Acb2/Tad1 hairpin domain-containing protein n=1 Tax=marine sediment metagenome TaxID=412755 RepID=X0UHP7_9ZZZZ
MLPWSKGAVSPPKPIAPDKFDPKERAFPFEDTLEEGGPNTPPIGIYLEGVFFRLQRGPIKEVGVNGCQIDDLIKFTADTIRAFNAKFPCRENSMAITKLEEAWLWCHARTADREARGVEGRDRK